jgi:hypothetical protein
MIESSAVGTMKISSPEGPAISMPAHIFPDASLGRSLLAADDLCNRGLRVLLTSTEFKAFDPATGVVLLSAPKQPHDKLWPIELVSTTTTTPTADHAEHWCGNSVRNQPDAEYVLYSHCCFGSPTTSTFLEAVLDEVIYPIGRD